MNIKLIIHIQVKKFVRQFELLKYTYQFSLKLILTFIKKECYYGPFTGEFGHLLGHNLPFISYLYKKGVRVNFCGLEIHRPFFKDEANNDIVCTYVSLRDFFNESAPDCNKAIEPTDVADKSLKFIEEAKKSGLPVWDNNNLDYYFNFFRWWIAKMRYLKVYDLSKIYKTSDENSVVIFPRKWNTSSTDYSRQLKNNGENWDYLEVARAVSPYFDKVYILGHPVFSTVNFDSFDNVEVFLTNDNKFILEKCSNSKLIISQHSGTVYLGEYTNTQVLIIYKGGLEIGDIEITKHFKKSLGQKHKFDYAFSVEEIQKSVKNIYETVRN